MSLLESKKCCMMCTQLSTYRKRCVCVCVCRERERDEHKIRKNCINKKQEMTNGYKEKEKVLIWLPSL